MANSIKKISFSTSPKAEQFVPKFHRLVLGIVGLINMVVRLSDACSKKG